jgi:hypothetical protein
MVNNIIVRDKYPDIDSSLIIQRAFSDDRTVNKLEGQSCSKYVRLMKHLSALL